MQVSSHVTSHHSLIHMTYSILELNYCQQVPVTYVAIMADLCNRSGHYIFVLWFLLSFFFLSFFSSPILSRRRLDVYHTATHGVALMRI